MKKIFSLILLFLICLSLKSQVTYTMMDKYYNAEPFNVGVNINSGIDDIFSMVVPIGFTFNFFGNNYNSFICSSNGSVSFDTSLAGTYSTWSLSTGPLPFNSPAFNNSILSPYHDLLPSNPEAKIYLNLKGIPPFRSLIISFDSLSLFSCYTLSSSSQIILYESSNYIDINIKNKPSCNSWNGGLAILGIQNSDGTVAYCPPSKNCTQWTTSSESWRFMPSTSMNISAPTIVVADSNSFCSSQVKSVDSALVINDSYNTVLEGAKVYFPNGYVNGQDILSFTPQYGITGTFNSTNGVLSLSGNATSLEYQTVLRSVKYQNLSSACLVTKKLYFSLTNDVYNSNNGHFYKHIYSPSINWFAARNSAMNKYLFSNQGYLATITDSQENEIVASLILSGQEYWVGASDSSQEGLWRWVTGCEGLENSGLGRIFSSQNKIGASSAFPGSSIGGNYTNWQVYSDGTGEPNDWGCFPANHCEDFMAYNTYGKWNDYNSNSSYVNHYIVEFGCSNIGFGLVDSIDIVVQPCNLGPDIPVISLSSLSSTSICNGDTILAYIASGNLNSATGWEWYYNGSCGVGSSVIGGGFYFLNYGPGYHTLYVRGVGGCTTPGPCASVTFYVNPLPTVTSFNVNGCVNTPILLSGTPAGGTFNISGIGSTTNQYITFTTAGARFYTYTYTDLNGCTATSTQHTINVLPSPTIAVNALPSNLICQNSPIILTATGASSYNWHSPTSPVGDPVNGVPFIPPSSGTYTVYGIDLNGCQGMSTASITIANPPSMPTIIGDTICGTGIVNLSASSSGLLSWYTTAIGGSAINTGTTYNPSISSSTTFYVDNTELIGSVGNILNLGPPSNSVGAGLQSSLNQWQLFNVLQPCTLQSVIVYPGAAGNVVLEQRNSTGTVVLNTTTMAVTAAQIGIPVAMTLNWPLAVGTGYRLYRGSSSVSLYRSSSGIVYPYANALVSITGNSLNPAYYYWAYNWTLSNQVNHYCSSARVPVIATVNSCLNLTLYIQGYYIGGNSMNSALLNEGIGLSNTITDSIDVELRSSISPYAVLTSTKTLLHTDGTAMCSFPSISGSYYIVIKHRNAVQTWSANPINFGSSTVNYNFSNSLNQAYGNNMIEAEPGIYAFYSGDINQDENIDLVDLSLLELDITNFQFGYFSTDLNGDGNVDLWDVPYLESNLNSFIFSNHP